LSLGSVAILVAGIVCARGRPAEPATERLSPLAPVLGLGGAVLSFVALFVDYDGSSSLVDELEVFKAILLEPGVAIAMMVGAVVLLAVGRRQLASGLLLAVGAQTALHFLGVIIASQMAVGEPGEVRAGGFIGLLGGLLVVAAGVRASRSKEPGARIPLPS
jgi:hypothetical protein